MRGGRSLDLRPYTSFLPLRPSSFPCYVPTAALVAHLLLLVIMVNKLSFAKQGRNLSWFGTFPEGWCWFMGCVCIQSGSKRRSEKTKARKNCPEELQRARTKQEHRGKESKQKRQRQSERARAKSSVHRRLIRRTKERGNGSCGPRTSRLSSR